MDALSLLTLTARASSGLFAGIAVGVVLIGPHLRSRHGLALFQAFYNPAKNVQAPLTFVAIVSSLGAYYLNGKLEFALTGALFAASLLGTLSYLIPINEALIGTKPKDENEPRVLALLAKWTTGHAIRTVITTVAFILTLL